MTDRPQPDLFDGDPPVHRNPVDTEVAAAERIKPRAPTLRMQVFLAIRDEILGGLAGFQVCDLFPNVNPYSIRPRLTELEDRGLIEKSGVRRENHYGNKEVVWVPTTKGLQLTIERGSES